MPLAPWICRSPPGIRQRHMMQRCRSCGVPKGTQQAGCWQAAAHWSGRRSRDCNLGPATPSDVRGNRRIIVGCPRSWRNGRPGPLLGQMVSLCAEFLCTFWRIFPCCSLGQGCTCCAGYEVVKVEAGVTQA